MMRYLLDTHVFVWLVEDPGKLPARLLAELASLDTKVFVSAASFWEIAMNRNRGRMKFNGSVAEAIRMANFTELPVTGAHYEASVQLPDIHKDPFDRLLLAQAQAERLVLVTHDAAMKAYNVPMLRV